MRLNICIILIAVNLLVTTCALAQMIGTDHVMCSDLVRSIKIEYERGHYFAMDSLYEKFCQKECTKEADLYITAMEIIKLQRMAGYRKTEVDSLQKLIDETKAKEATTTETATLFEGFRYFHIGPSTSFHFARDSYSLGAMAGWHSSGNYGIDFGFYYQRLPFEINEVNNQDENNNYTANGFLLKTKGYTTFYKIPAIISLNIEEEDLKVGIGFFAGVEIFKVKTTYIRNYYHEFNYNDNVDENGVHNLQFNEIVKKNVETGSFLRSSVNTNFLFGLNVYHRPVERFLITWSGFYSFPVKLPRLEDFNVRVHTDYLGLRMTASILFIRKTKNVSRRSKGLFGNSFMK